MNRLRDFLNRDFFWRETGINFEESTYNRLSLESFSLLNLATFKRLERQNLSEEVKRAVTDTLVQTIVGFYDLETFEDREQIEREKIGSHEVTYKVNKKLSSVELMREKEMLAFAIFKRHLGHTGLLYRGR